MTIKDSVDGALSAVLSHSYSVELPPRPVWPSIVYDIDTTPEDTWVMGGGYDQHVVSVVTLARTVKEIDLLKPQIRTAMSAIPGFMFPEDEGDADYEGDAQVYAYFQNFRIRTRTS